MLKYNFHFAFLNEMGHQFEHMYNMYFMIANQFVKKNFVFPDYFSSNLNFFQALCRTQATNGTIR